MSMTAEKLVAEGLERPRHMRAFVVEKLIGSLDVAPEAGLSAAWREELAERCREMDEGGRLTAASNPGSWRNCRIVAIFDSFLAECSPKMTLPVDSQPVAPFTHRAAGSNSHAEHAEDAEEDRGMDN